MNLIWFVGYVVASLLIYSMVIGPGLVYLFRMILENVWKM
jgi:hypothetical protein